MLATATCTYRCLSSQQLEVIYTVQLSAGDLRAGGSESASARVAAAVKIVQAIARGPSGRPFSYPITDDMVPGYSAVVQHPMDLTTVAQRLSDGAYASLGEQALLHSTWAQPVLKYLT